jgi:hypothetical protein
MSAFQAGAVREVCVELVRGCLLGGMSVYATAGGMAATPGAAVPTINVE